MFFWKKGRLKQDLASLGKAGKTVPGDRTPTARYRAQEISSRSEEELVQGYFWPDIY